MNNDMQTFGQWSCPKCGAVNLPMEMFCKNCGSAKNILSGTLEVEQKSNIWKKIIIIAISVLALAGIAAAGAYYYYTYNQKKQAKAYLVNEAKSFSDSISFINDLSTEKVVDVDNREENFELYLKKIEDEKNKSEKNISDIKNLAEVNKKTNPNKTVFGIDSLIKSYYKNLETNLVAYNKFLTYDFVTSKESKVFDDEFEKLQKIYEGDFKSIEEAIKSLKDAKALIENYLAKIKTIEVPAGMEEYNGIEIKVSEILLTFYSDLIAAMEKKDLAKLEQVVGRDIDGEISKNYKESKRLYDYHFEEIHKKFIESRKEADNIKTELIKAAVGFKMEIPVANIEAW